MALARERSPRPSSERVPGPRLSAAVQELVVTWRGRLPRVSLRALSLLPPAPHPVDNLLGKLSGFEIYAFPCPKFPRTAPHAGSLRSPPPAAGSRLHHDPARPRTVGTPHCSARVPAPDGVGSSGSVLGGVGVVRVLDLTLVPYSVTLTLEGSGCSLNKRSLSCRTG